jgi:hypothetical protein
MDLQIEYVPLSEIKPYKGNAKEHPQEQIEQIKKSMQEFGVKDPIGIWHNEIVEGHGRYLALKELGETQVPVIRLDDLTDEQRRAYTLVHNQLTMNSGFDLDTLKVELDNIGEIDMSEFGFSLDDFDVNGEDSAENKYTEDIKAPQYEVKGEKPKIKDLVDKTKVLALEEEIKASKIDEQVKEFLLMAAKRHYVFDYAKIAEYYAQASPEVQELMERSALVIIDYDDAILNGYVEFAKNVGEMGDDNAE